MLNIDYKMDKLVRDFVEENIDEFHNKRVARLQGLKLKELLLRKNPYLFRVKDPESVPDLIQPMLDAHLSSQEETVFGYFLEGLARRVCEVVRNGYVSGIQGIDLEFDDQTTRYIISLKSGPNWGNSSQVTRMRTDFRRAAQILRRRNSRMHVQAVNGCCYGLTSPNYDHGDYWKLAGQEFWELIAKDRDFFIRIVDPLTYHAMATDEEFKESYSKVLNRLVAEFIADFSTPDFKIDWDRLVEFNSKSAV